MTDHIDLHEDEDWLVALSADGWAPMDHAPHNAEVAEHIHRCFGEPAVILHETLSKYAPIDIHVIPPASGRGFTTYVTSGMSDLPVQTPEGMADWARAELLVALEGPPKAHLDVFGRPHYLIDHLRNYARRPHALGACFLPGDTIGPFEPGESIGPDTNLSAFLLTRPVLTPIVDSIGAFRFALSTGEAVNVFALEALHAEELAMQQKNGPEALIERLEAAGVFEIYDPNRPIVATPKARGFSLKRMFGG